METQIKSENELVKGDLKEIEEPLSEESEESEEIEKESLSDIPLVTPPSEEDLNNLIHSLIEEHQKMSKELSMCSAEIKHSTQQAENTRKSFTAYQKRKEKRSTQRNLIQQPTTNVTKKLTPKAYK